MNAHQPFRRSDFLAPRHWPSWLGFGCLRLLVRLPFGAQIAIGSAFGTLLYWLLPGRRRVAEINLRIAFPDRSAAARAALLRRHYRALGVGVFEIGMAWWRDREWLLRHCRIEGLDNLRRAQADGRGVLLVFAHFTTLELTAIALAHCHPLSAVYGEPKNALFRALLNHYRLGAVEELVETRDVRRTLRLLKQGRILCYLPDQSTMASRGGILVPFFGREVLTTPGTSRLARAAGARVVPMFPRRLPGRGGYLIRCLPALEDFPGESVAADTRRINALFEEQIRQAPDQYLWVHQRFKRGPAGSGNPYR